jgi:type II secretory pathway pseudopilin PulG
MIKSTKSKLGFSLIETVIVLGLFVILLLVIYGTFLISNKSFYTSDRKLELAQNGRIVLDRLSRELRQSIEIITPLPATKNDPGFPPANEIQFQDGHGLTTIQYLKYYLNNQELNRQRIVYYFSEEPSNYVYWNTVNQFGQLPQSQIVEEKTIAEYCNNLLFFGDDLINIDLYLTKQNSQLHLFTTIYGRNKR